MSRRARAPEPPHLDPDKREQPPTEVPPVSSLTGRSHFDHLSDERFAPSASVPDAGSRDRFGLPVPWSRAIVRRRAIAAIGSPKRSVADHGCEIQRRGSPCHAHGSPGRCWSSFWLCAAGWSACSLRLSCPSLCWRGRGPGLIRVRPQGIRSWSRVGRECSSRAAQLRSPPGRLIGPRAEPAAPPVLPLIRGDRRRSRRGAAPRRRSRLIRSAIGSGSRASSSPSTTRPPSGGSTADA